MRKSIIAMIIISLIPLYLYSSGEEAKLFQKANENFRMGRYEDARRGYESILKSGIDTDVIHYNLGNCLFRNGEAGMALAEYDRALIRNPLNPAAKKNAKFVMSVMPKSDELEPAKGLSYSMQILIPNAYARFLFLLSIWLFNILLSLVFIKSLWKKRTAIYFLIIIFFISLVCGTIVAIQILNIGGYRGVIISPIASVMPGPIEGETPIATLPQGLHVNIREKQDKWVFIEWAKGQGWLNESDIMDIR